MSPKYCLLFSWKFYSIASGLVLVHSHIKSLNLLSYKMKRLCEEKLKFFVKICLTMKQYNNVNRYIFYSTLIYTIVSQSQSEGIGWNQPYHLLVRIYTSNKSITGRVFLRSSISYRITFCQILWLRLHSLR